MPDGDLRHLAEVEEINIGVRARLVEDAGTVEAVTRAYAAKYGDSPYVGPLLTRRRPTRRCGWRSGRSDRGRRPTLT